MSIVKMQEASISGPEEFITRGSVENHFTQTTFGDH
jgi:hypothetical protein